MILVSCRCFQVELMRGYDYSSFHDDLKKLYDSAGMRNEPIVFLFTDTQIAYEEFLEDINNILNSGAWKNFISIHLVLNVTFKLNIFLSCYSSGEVPNLLGK